jgi:cell division protein ZapA
MKQLEVQIMGQSYLLGCPDGGDSRLLEAVERVDTAMCKIRDAGKVRARERIAVLAALNLAFDLTDRGTTPLQTSAHAIPQGSESEAADDMKATRHDLQLASLLHRLDVALGEDGCLI